MRQSEWHGLLGEIGIAVCGVADASRPVTYDIFLNQISGGVPPGLGYLQKNAACRSGYDSLLPKTGSVLCFGLALPRMSPSALCRFAGFCAVGDYHVVLRERIAIARDFLKHHFRFADSRICVDTAPILERELAVRAGFGSLGFNRMLIHPHLGSYLVLGELLLDMDMTAHARDLAFNAVPMHNPGQVIPGAVGCCHPDCRKCIQSCPCGALSPLGYDMSRCLAYWTTQHRGEIPDEFASAMGDVIWGCDRCQISCPRNRNSDIPFNVDNPLNTLTLTEILTLSARKLRMRLSGTPVADAHPHMLQRNACIVIANTRDISQINILEQTAHNHTCEWVRSTAFKSLGIVRRPHCQERSE